MCSITVSSDPVEVTSCYHSRNTFEGFVYLLFTQHKQTNFINSGEFVLKKQKRLNETVLVGHIVESIVVLTVECFFLHFYLSS